VPPFEILLTVQPCARFVSPGPMDNCDDRNRNSAFRTAQRQHFSCTRF
jgi:hypothetical protein